MDNLDKKIRELDEHLKEIKKSTFYVPFPRLHGFPLDWGFSLLEVIRELKDENE